MLLDLLFKHITNVSVLIRCVKNVSIISQFKIPSCEKNAPPFGFICFIFYTIFKEDNTPVIFIHGPHLRGYPWNSRGKVLDNYILIVPAVPGKCGGILLGHLPCWDFLLCMVGQRAGLLPSARPHRAGLIPGLWKVKIIMSAHPRRWGSSGYK